MEIGAPNGADWKCFLRMAAEEGWRVPAREVDLFRGPFSNGAYVLREGARAVGFVTVLPHERSGWIGNLLVHRTRRGNGLGLLLFEHAVRTLQRQGCGSIWLTASPAGRPLYERKGFCTVDRIVRWVLRPRGESLAMAEGRGGLSVLLEGDRLVWGESRRDLIGNLAFPGKVFAFGGTAALLQQGRGMQVLGPWFSRDLCPRENRRLILAVLAAAKEGEEVVADVLGSSPIQPLLRAAGFETTGECDLMVLGEAQGVELHHLVSLASLGSMG